MKVEHEIAEILRQLNEQLTVNDPRAKRDAAHACCVKLEALLSTVDTEQRPLVEQCLLNQVLNQRVSHALMALRDRGHKALSTMHQLDCHVWLRMTAYFQFQRSRNWPIGVRRLVPPR